MSSAALQLNTIELLFFVAKFKGEFKETPGLYTAAIKGREAKNKSAKKIKAFTLIISPSFLGIAFNLAGIKPYIFIL